MDEHVLAIFAVAAEMIDRFIYFCLRIVAGFRITNAPIKSGLPPR
jgi:hypothetical protein